MKDVFDEIRESCMKDARIGRSSMSAILSIIDEAEAKYNDKEIRNKVIDELTSETDKKLSEFILEHQNQLTLVSGVAIGGHIMDEVAEKLKT